MSMIDELEGIAASARERIEQAQSLEALDAVRVAVTGKKGQLTAVLRSMGSLTPEERPQVGKLANEVRRQVEAELAERKAQLEAAELAARIEASSVDVTLPGRRPHVGTQHLISQIVDEIQDIFIGLGYSIESGPYVETEYYNFTSLNAPADHPSRSPRDTFYVEDPLNPSAGSLVSDVLLRTQTSPVQARVMEQGRLLEEITAEALHDKCRICLRLEVADAARAAAILQTQLGTDKFEVLPGDAIQLYDCLDDPKRASYALAQNGVALLAMEQKGADLEAYFLNLIGGGRHV